MQEGIITDPLKAAMLQNLKAVGQPLAAATLILLTGTVNESPFTTMANLTEASFEGYAAVENLAFSNVYLDSQGRRMLAGDDTTFICTGGTTAQEVTGWAVVNAAKTVVYAVRRLDNPVNMNTIGRGINVQPAIAWPNPEA